MSELNGNLYTKQTADQAAKYLPNEAGGKIRVARDVIVLASGAAVGDTINLFKLPCGARLLETSELRIASGGPTASTTIQAGDATSAARYLAAVAPGVSGGTVKLDALQFTSGGYVVTSGNETVRLTVSGGVLSSGTVIGMQLEYVDY